MQFRNHCTNTFITRFSIYLHKRKQRRKHNKIFLLTSQAGNYVNKSSQNERNVLIKHKHNAEECSLWIATHTGSRMQRIRLQIKCSRHTIESFKLQQKNQKSETYDTRIHFRKSITKVQPHQLTNSDVTIQHARCSILSDMSNTTHCSFRITALTHLQTQYTLMITAQSAESYVTPLQ